MQPIHIHLDVPDAFRAKAEYGMRMLLLPYRAEPVFGREGGNGDIAVDVYYGQDEKKAKGASVGVIFHASTADWFDTGNAGFPPHRFVKVDDQRIPVCFQAGGQWGFDPVASVIYLLSGWQEIVLRTRDEHGRFPFNASFQAHTDSRMVPIVDWIRHIVADALRKAGVVLERRTFGTASWAFCATHDIDYVRKWRPGIWKRELLDRAVLNHAHENAGRRMTRARRAIWSFFESGDPFRAALARIPAELESRNARGTFFYKAAAYGYRDVGYSLEDPAIHAAIERQLLAGHEIALHPSYHSHAHPARLHQERHALRVASGQDVNAYRAHYLRHQHPASIHHLGTAGFEVDSTLGWASCTGFRFGTCLPFPLYDPLADEESTVWEMPLIAMESAMFNRQGLSLEDACQETRFLMEVCRSFGGVFTGLWHNTLWDEVDYPGWGAHFEDSVSFAAESGARMDTLSAILAEWS